MRVLALSAATPEELRAKARRYAQRMAVTGPAADDLRRRANAGANTHAHRLAAVGDSNGALVWQLGAFARGEQNAHVALGTRRGASSSRVAFLFTGVGSEFVGMGRRLFAAQPVFRRELERCDRLFRSITGRPLLSPADPPFGDQLALDDTAIVQPALFAFEYALAQLWRDWGVEPSALFGHSLGEDVAACVGGVLSLPDALTFVAGRARLLEQLSADGAMAAIFTAEERVRDALRAYRGEIEIAAINEPANVLVAGPSSSLQDLLMRFERAGVRTRPLKASRAFHCALVDPALSGIEAIAGRVAFAAPRVPIVCGATGAWAGIADITQPWYWRRHVREAVRFADGLRRLWADGYRIFVEIGPHPTLLGMVRRSLPTEDVTLAPTLRRAEDDLSVACSSLAHVFVRGVNVRWGALDFRTAAFEPRRPLFETRR